jgi:hypothetical protein
MPRWTKRLEAARYAGVGRSKLDKLIGQNLIQAKKEDGSPNAPVYVDLDSIDAFFANLRKAPGLRKAPKGKRELTEHP